MTFGLPALKYFSTFLIRLSSFLILLASVAIIFGAIKFATKKLFTRLYVVMDGMHEIRRGNIDVRVHVSGNDEVAEMARTFSATSSIERWPKWR